MTGPGLDGAVVALSLSPANDLARLGYHAREFDSLTFELALQIVRRGGRVLYGGHLHENGLALPIFEHVAAAYGSGAARRDAAAPKPVLSFLAAKELGKTPFDRLVGVLERTQGFVEMQIHIAPQRHVVPFTRQDRESGQATLTMTERGRAPVTLADQAALDAFVAAEVAVSEAEALTLMRQAAAGLAQARIVLGGRRGDLGIAAADRFNGAIPGIYEEIVASLSRCPVAILAAYGGAAREAAFDLGLLDATDPRAPFLGAEQDGVADGRAALLRARDALPAESRSAFERFAEFARRDDGPLLARDVVRRIAEALSGG